MTASARGYRLGVVGCGAVGSTFAYTALIRGLAQELVLIDINRDKALGDALDMSHGAPFVPPCRVVAGDYPDLAGCQVVVIAAGVAQRPGETRLQLLQRNAQVMAEVVPAIVRHAPDAILLVATNPVDILAYQAHKISGLPVERVVGSGTLLDTARFRYRIGQELGIHPRSVHAYIIGEHGDSEVPVWSGTTVAGSPLGDKPPLGLTPEQRKAIFVETRDAAYRIIAAKGATYYAIALALARICEAILGDENSVLTVSTLVPQYGVYMGMPCVVGRHGARGPLPLTLRPEEQQALDRSAAILKETIQALGL
ncbi:MAG: L-lactate dehydrogenase [Bacillota bacterium]|nr:MAG: L-lactate dehydrogenase [Bacillota bacterium]